MKVVNGMNLVGKNIHVVGMGLTGLSCVKFLLARGANVTAMDSRSELTLGLDIPIVLGELSGEILAQSDLIVLSPGVDLHKPAIIQAQQAGVPVIGDIELFARFNDRPVIAITGSNGKSTVTHLVADMCKAAGKSVLMGGNIGVPALDLLSQDGDLIVLELSSFQLETLESLKPLVATILNISEDHLDRHGNLEHYKQIKHRIYQHCQYVVCNRDAPDTVAHNMSVRLHYGLSPSQQGFSWDPLQGDILFEGVTYLDSSSCLLVGAHNMLNIQAAAALAKVYGIDDCSIRRGARQFGGLPHRCQTVAVINNVRWINDSKATNVGATTAAIEGLSASVQGKLILIAGGEGKGADFSVMKQCFQHWVSTVITLGKDGHKIAALHDNSYQVEDISAAVTLAAAQSQPGDIVLLSPACASLDMFVNYQHRGDSFVQAVQRLAA